MLFGCLFAAQASLVVLSPILTRVALDLHVTVVQVGQLRTISGVVAATVAVVMVTTNRHYDLRGMLALGLGLLAVGSLASAVAPNFAVLASMQAVLGAGVALSLTGGLTATRQWIPAGHRGRALSWALMGQPTAWIIALPVVGMLGDYNWRLTWLVPVLASMATLTAVLQRHRTRPAASELSALPSNRTAEFTWAVAEMLAFAGWTGVLVYAGALFAETYATSIGTTGLLLGLGAAAYLPGNLLARRWIGTAALPLSIGLACVMATTGLLLCVVRPSATFSVAVFGLFSFLGGARTISGSALGLRLGGADPLRAMSLRTASVQFGYMAGAGLGGLCLAAAGWNGLGIMLVVFLMLSAILLLASRPPRSESRRPRPPLVPHAGDRSQ